MKIHQRWELGLTPYSTFSPIKENFSSSQNVRNSDELWSIVFQKKTSYFASSLCFYVSTHSINSILAFFTHMQCLFQSIFVQVTTWIFICPPIRLASDFFLLIILHYLVYLLLLLAECNKETLNVPLSDPMYAQNYIPI